MGFFKTAVNEFGKKTGKALGNKLYGAYGDDKRVGVNRGKLKGESDGLKIAMENQNRQAEMEYEREMLKQNKELFEQKKEMLDNVLNLTLDPTNKEELIKSVTTLSVYADLWAKEENPDEHLVAAKSKFDAGVAMLQAVDPANPMVYYFLQKKTESERKKDGFRQKEKRKKIAEIIGIVILVVVCLGIVLAASAGLLG